MVPGFPAPMVDIPPWLLATGSLGRCLSWVHPSWQDFIPSPRALSWDSKVGKWGQPGLRDDAVC